MINTIAHCARHAQLDAVRPRTAPYLIEPPGPARESETPTSRFLLVFKDDSYSKVDTVCVCCVVRGYESAQHKDMEDLDLDGFFVGARGIVCFEKVILAFVIRHSSKLRLLRRSIAWYGTVVWHEVEGTRGKATVVCIDRGRGKSSFVTTASRCSLEKSVSPIIM